MSRYAWCIGARRANRQKAEPHNFRDRQAVAGRIRCFFHSEHRQIPLLRRRHPDPLVEIHPETAEKLKIKDGDWIWIETARGRIKQKAKLTYGIDPRVARVEHA